MLSEPQIVVMYITGFIDSKKTVFEYFDQMVAKYDNLYFATFLIETPLYNFWIKLLFPNIDIPRL